MELRARIAGQKDLMLTYKWANDPLTREMTLRQGIISQDAHRESFTGLLRDKNILLLIIEGLDDDTWLPIGQVMFHANGTINLSIGDEHRGRHLATPAILAALKFAKDNFPIDTVTAHIRFGNIPSIKAFERAGFTYNGMTESHPSIEYIFNLKKRAA